MGIFNKKIVLGGEHYFSPSYFFKKNNHYIDNLIEVFKEDYYINFTFGGYFSILAILEDIISKNSNNFVVLLPSYLCPSILKPFQLKGIQYKFYKVDEDLFIDTTHLISQIDNNVKAVFFIDYFGASQLYRLTDVINLLKSKNIVIIQDVVQCIKIEKDKLFGDYIFNSFRKFFPFEGSIILSKVKIIIDYSKSRNKYIKYKRIGQLLRFLYIEYGLFNNKIFLKFLKMSEDRYHSVVIIKMPRINYWFLNKVELEKLLLERIKNFNYLKAGMEYLMPSLLTKNDFIPLGFVIKHNKRDIIRKQFFKFKIYTPIHWIINDDILPTEFKESKKLSLSVLTIPLCLNKK